MSRNGTLQSTRSLQFLWLFYGCILSGDPLIRSKFMLVFFQQGHESAFIMCAMHFIWHPFKNFLFGKPRSSFACQFSWNLEQRFYDTCVFIECLFTLFWLLLFSFLSMSLSKICVAWNLFSCKGTLTQECISANWNLLYHFWLKLCSKPKERKYKMRKAEQADKGK